MARKPNLELRLEVPAGELHRGDVIVGRDGGWLYAEELRRSNGVVRMTLLAQGAPPVRCEVPADRLVPVLAEQDCGKCNGSGIFYGRGVVENGVFKGTTGECFACHGKGWQDRQDAIRNDTYWAKYARIYA